MKKITVRAGGDTWLNKDQVKDQLVNIQPTDWVCFDTGAEGISLGHSGILQFINQWVEESNHPQHRVVINSPNTYEKTIYQNINKADNHFLQLSGHYQTTVPSIDPTSRYFGLFVGRYTEERDRIAVDVFKKYQSHFIMSIMKTRFVPSPWDKKIQSVKSIDDLYVKDQYTGKIDTNLSLLKFYNQFQIELVAETMCAGTTFFPTEKTFRPITGRRPFLIFGPVNFLKNLKDLGFKTYNSCWDESYDSLTGLSRWEAIQKVIEQIINIGYDIDHACQIAEYNHNHLKQWHRYTMPKDMTRVINDN